MARVTGLEPATSGVTGRHSNQLSYTRAAGDARRPVEVDGAPGEVKRRSRLYPKPDATPAGAIDHRGKNVGREVATTAQKR